MSNERNAVSRNAVSGTTPTPEDDAQTGARRHIPMIAIMEGLQAVGSALGLPDDQVHTITKIASAEQENHTKNLLWEEWLNAARLMEFDSQSQLHVTNVAIALAFLRQSGRQDSAVFPIDLDRIWALIKNALCCTSLTWKITRSVDGSHAIAFWSLTKDSHIHELIRLHFWLPDAVRIDPDFSIHKHSIFAQSWILAGEGTDYTFEVTSAHENNATHAEYVQNSKEQDKDENSDGYPANGQPILTNTANLVHVLPQDTQLCIRNVSYNVPHDIFHKIEVEPDALHAKILFFDSSRGHNSKTPVLGPIAQKVSSGERKPAQLNVPDVANLIGDLRRWEILQENGLEYSDKGEWEDALRLYRTAERLCRDNSWLDRPRYLHFSLDTIAKMHRMQGRYDKACECLEEILSNTSQSRFRVNSAGELAMVYRHMDRLEDSKRAAEEQYHGAIQLNLEKFACRAIGNVGMVNYQLYLLSKDEKLLSSAISQFHERIERAKRFGDIVLEAIGYSRLSLCYIAQGEYDKAVEIAQKNYELTCMQPDATKIGFAKTFLGRALIKAGRRDEAVALFNAHDGCSPIISLCNEISGEHRQYIVEMINAGADLKLRNKQDYSALECAVYNGDSATAEIIEQGLRAQILREGGDVEAQLTQFKYEATLRKGYRDIFQDKLRPCLLSVEKDPTLETLRQIYAASLAGDTAKQSIFDGLKYVTYTEFLRSGRLPRSSSRCTQEYAKREDNSWIPFIVFFSYRWIAKDHNAQASGFSPDDAENTQYHRMCSAIEKFLEMHPNVNREHVCIWIVSPMAIYPQLSNTEVFY